MDTEQIAQEDLPNAILVLVLGIISLVTFGFLGIGVCVGIIALVLATRAGNLYKTRPGRYTDTSYKYLKAGKICALVGIFVSVLTFILGLLWMIPGK